MAYGDNRQQVASDTFDSSLDGSWTTGYDTYDGLEWISGGHVRDDTLSGLCVAKRNTGTYADAHYSTVTVQNWTTDTEIWATVRHTASDTDGSFYGGGNAGAGDQHKIYELSSAGAPSIINSTNTDPDAAGAGDLLTLEVEGTTLRYGDDINGADAQRLTQTDGTHSGGRPGMFGYSEGALNDCQITAWSGGDIAVVHTADGDATIPLITASGVTAYTGTGSPSIPLITADGDATVTPASSLSITSVSGDDEWTDGDTGIPIVGVGFV